MFDQPCIDSRPLENPQAPQAYKSLLMLRRSLSHARGQLLVSRHMASPVKTVSLSSVSVEELT